MKKCLFLLSGLAAALLSSCGSIPISGGGGSAAYAAYDRPATLPSNPSAVRVKVSLKNQMAYVMEGSKPLLIMPVSVGTSSDPTPRGNFRISGKTVKHRAYTHGFATKDGRVTSYYRGNPAPAGARKVGTPMAYWCQFKPAYGFHTGWLKHSPCTHGCLRMHENLSPKFFRLVKNGTPVNISYTQAEDATIGRNIPRPPDAGPLPDYPASLKMSDAIFSKHKKPTYN